MSNNINLQDMKELIKLKKENYDEYIQLLDNMSEVGFDMVISIQKAVKKVEEANK